MDHGVPESPKESMEFLSRTWSVSALEVCKALAHHNTNNNNNVINKGSYNTKSLNMSTCSTPPIIRENIIMNGEFHHQDLEFPPLSANHFSFNSSATSQLVLDRIMSHSHEVSPLTSGRLSHSSEPMNGVTSSTDSPDSPSEEFDDIVKFFRAHNSLQPLFTGKRCSVGNGNGVSTPSGAKTVGRWLKDRKEKKKEEARAQNAQLHAAISVASVAAAVAAIAAATAAASAKGKSEESAKTDMAVASAATLVAAQCVEAAEAMGAEHDHLASVVSSAVNVHSHDDITTLTAAAATALRGAATLKARTAKEFWNIAAVKPKPVEKGPTRGICGKGFTENPDSDYGDELPPGENFLGICIQEYLAKGSELLKRTRKGELHWKIVSAYINQSGQVVLKTKSRHVAGTITKRKKNIVLEVCKAVPAWPGRHLFDGGEQRMYFGLKTATRGITEFECKNKREYEIWTQGVSRLLSLVSERKDT